MSKKLLFVFNPLSGRVQIKKKLLSIIDIFTKAGYEVISVPTQCKLDGYNIIKNHYKHKELIVCSGGDGTLNEAIMALMECEEKPPLGYIPSGSTNDYGFSLGIPSDMEEAARCIVNGVPFACDVGCFNGKYYSYVAAFGAFVNVSYQTPQNIKNAIGHLAYVLEGIKSLPSIKSYKLKVITDKEIYEDEYLVGLVTNSVSIGGYRKFTELGIMFDDGLFEVTLIKRPRNPIEIQSIISSLLSQKFDSPYIVTFRTDNVDFHSEEEIEWTLDGENGGLHNDVNIKVIPRAIKIIVPKPSDNNEKKNDK